MKKQLFIATKKRELTLQQLKLFSKYVPATNPKDLKEPNITFLKNESYLYIYKMTMVDTSQRRPLTLVMYRAYNTKTGKWESYQESN